MQFVTLAGPHPRTIPSSLLEIQFEMQFEMGCACRHGEAPVVADVLIAVVRSSDIADARDLTAVLIARGCVCGPHLLS